MQRPEETDRLLSKKPLLTTRAVGGGAGATHTHAKASSTIINLLQHELIVQLRVHFENVALQVLGFVFGFGPIFVMDD